MTNFFVAAIFLKSYQYLATWHQIMRQDMRWRLRQSALSFQFHHFANSGSLSLEVTECTAHLNEYRTHRSIRWPRSSQRSANICSGSWLRRSAGAQNPKSLRSCARLGPMLGGVLSCVVFFGFPISEPRAMPTHSTSKPMTSFGGYL